MAEGGKEGFHILIRSECETGAFFGISYKEHHVFRHCMYVLFLLAIISWETNSVQQSPSWEAYSLISGEEIHLLLWKLMVHYSVHKIPPLKPVLRRI
jgi:hypothetical protein